MEENIDFLNKKREENKQKKLSILNNKTVDDNQLITNLKKAGIKNNLMDNDDEELKENFDINDLYNNNEKNDKPLSAIDEDNDDEDMLYEDMGFIYS
jgi:inner membrane protein involved in colicin E2 resistance